MSILHEIAERTKARIEERKLAFPLQQMTEAACLGEADTGFPFEKALRGAGDIAFICEIKKASPSKGVIASDFPYVDIARDYEQAGAAAISILTEPYYFMGDDRYLREIADAVDIPLLRKDFTVDEYMIYQAKALGASAVLLICSILNSDELTEFIHIAHSLGLSALVEVHEEGEVQMALDAGARIIGGNNRDLKTFEVDINLAVKLRERVPKDIIFVAESGIQTFKDVDMLRRAGADALLIGETLMKSRDKKAMFAELWGNSK